MFLKKKKLCIRSTPVRETKPKIRQGTFHDLKKVSVIKNGRQVDKDGKVSFFLMHHLHVTHITDSHLQLYVILHFVHNKNDSFFMTVNTRYSLEDGSYCCVQMTSCSSQDCLGQGEIHQLIKNSLFCHFHPMCPKVTQDESDKVIVCFAGGREGSIHCQC